MSKMIQGTYGRGLLAAAGCLALAAGCGQVQAPVEQTAETAEAFGDEVCITIQRGVFGAVVDTHLADDKPNKNWATSNVFSAGLSSPGLREALVRYDVSAIPPDSTIVSAVASFHVILYGGAPLAIHRVAAPWGENTVTYQSFGGAFFPAIEAVLPSTPYLTLPGDLVTSADIQSLVQGWVSGAITNDGILIDRDLTAATSFYSSDWTNVAQRPSLDVCYIPGPCAGMPDGAACNDNDACTQTDTCQAGWCVGSHPVVCTASDACHLDGACDPETGACTNPVAPDGSYCDDGDLCTGPDTCTSGTCGGTPLACDDGIACSVDSCSPTGGCVHDYSGCGSQICGTVSESSGGITSPASGASVTLGCNAADNIIKGKTTAPDGTYCMQLTLDELSSCSTFYLAAKQTGFMAQNKTAPGDFTVPQTGTVNVDFVLPEEIAGVCFVDGFEFADNVETAQPWTISSSVDGVQWQRKANAPVVVDNAFGVCTALPEDEVSMLCQVPGSNACLEQPGAISNAYSGDYAFWFGNPNQGTYVGNFMGASGNCASNNGGQGGVVVSGTLTSPLFFLPAGTAILQFRSWWEVESTDPQQFAFDRMVVEILDASGNVLGQQTLNPEVDANGPANWSYSSGGYHRTPVWNIYSYNLESTAGQSMRVRFSFNSNDHLYNGYRGWLIDDVVVTSPDCSIALP